MRRLVCALLLGLVFVPFPLHAQTVSLTVCNLGAVDIDVFVSQAGTHIRPATCTVVAASSGPMEPAFVGLAFADDRGQLGAARRFDGVPSMGVKNFPVATRLAMSFRRETPPRVLTLATRSETVRRGNVSVPMQLLFQPSIPGCRAVPTGGGATLGRTTIVEVTSICEDLGYTLTVEAHPDSREITLDSLPVAGEVTEDGPVRISEKTIVNWAEEEADRKAREAPEPVNWSDLLPFLRRSDGRAELRDVLPAHIAIRGTVSGVDVNPWGIDDIQVVNVVFRESPIVPDSRNPNREPYAEFNVCTTNPDIFQDVFGADFRASMIGQSIEVRGEPGGVFCRGQRGSIGVTLARQVRPVPSAQFAAGTRAWVPPPVVTPAPRPAPTTAEIEAGIARQANGAVSQVEDRAKARLNAACAQRTDRALTANPGNRDAIVKEYAACQQAANAEARQEWQKARACAEQVIRADPANPDGSSRDFEGLQRALRACTQAESAK